MNHPDDLLDEPIAPRPRVQQRMHPGWLLWLLVPVVAVGMNWARIAAYLEPARVDPPAEVVERYESPVVESAPVSAPVVRAVAPVVPKTLQECIGADNVVNDQVLRCRYGDRPQPMREERAVQGMVSAQYLAEYKAGKSAQPVRRVGSSSGSESHQILGWDRKRSYTASWSVSDNRVDHGSVCGGYRGGSIEYRECRKGAKQWFKEQCRVERNPALRERYCSAASGFSPMG
jgi:hypothetical protein